jgi:hypothetical protein
MAAKVSFQEVSQPMCTSDQPQPINGAANAQIKIRNWPDETDPIHDGTPLIRYMRLEAFLLFLLEEHAGPSCQLCIGSMGVIGRLS